MEKFIRVLKNYPDGHQKSHAWRIRCKEERIPYVAILIDGTHISIGASLIHLHTIEGKKLVLDTQALEDEFRKLAAGFTDNIKGYWNFNDLYHLFDFMPEAEVNRMAESVYDIMVKHISFTDK